MREAATEERLALEFRGLASDLVVASADALRGSGLDAVSKASKEAEILPRVLVYSCGLTSSQLQARRPTELWIQDCLGAPMDADAVAEAAVGILGGEKPIAVAPPAPEPLLLAAPASQHSLGGYAVARALAAAAYHRWTGKLTVTDASDGAWHLWLNGGDLIRCASSAGRDLVATAAEEGRLEGVDLPDVSLNSLEEEVGLLLAVRAVGMHEISWLYERCRARLVREALSADEGELYALAGESPEEAAPQSQKVQAALLDAALDRPVDPLGERDLLVSRIATGDPIESWSFPDGLAAALAQLRAQGGLGLSVAEFVDLLGAELRDVGRKGLQLLIQIGMIEVREAETGAGDRADDRADDSEVVEYLKELHRMRRTHAFGVLELGEQADGKEIREAFRDKSRSYHPDRFFQESERLQAVASALFDRVRTASDALDSEQKRARLRRELRDGAEEAAARDANRAKVAAGQAKLLLKNKRYAEAAERFDEAALFDPGNLEARTEGAWAFFLSDRAQAPQARQSLARVIKEGPRSQTLRARFLLGRVALLLGEVPQARRLFEEIVQLKPDHHDAQRELRLMDKRGQGLSEVSDAEGPRGFLDRLRGR